MTEADEPVERHGPTTDNRIPTTALKDAVLAEIRKQKKLLYGTVIAQAQRIEITGDTMTFMFGPAHKLLRSQLDQQRASVEAIIEPLAGRRIAVKTIEGQPAPGSPGGVVSDADRRKEELKKQALEQPSVQSVLDVFGAEIQEVEEIDK